MSADCGFPHCPETPRDNGMCLHHANVHVSTTGSWLEDDQHHHTNTNQE